MQRCAGDNESTGALAQELVLEGGRDRLRRVGSWSLPLTPAVWIGTHLPSGIPFRLRLEMECQPANYVIDEIGPVQTARGASHNLILVAFQIRIIKFIFRKQRSRQQ